MFKAVLPNGIMTFTPNALNKPECLRNSNDGSNLKRVRLRSKFA